MSFIPEDTIDQILSRIDIVEIISSYIPLKQTGRNFKAHCPFHSEKTPSFVVSPMRQIYHCFGCGQGGNVFSFIMQYEKLTFQESAEILAKRAGVELPKTSNHAQKSINRIIYEINEFACQHYEKNLFSVSGNRASQYLQKRGIKEETAKQFRIGFALSSFEGLLNFLRQKNYTLNVLEKAGVIVSKTGGGYCDLLRNRLVFPIADSRDRIIGFGGRVFDDSLPKYINSPETSVYAKRRNLYGLNNAKEYVKDKDCLIIVEGYLDVITLKQAGIGYVVSSSGTALTQEQIRLIKRFTNNVIMIFDSDKAGQAATLRTLDVFIEEEVNVKIAVLPKGNDPDSFIRNEGVEKFSEALNSVNDLFSYKLKTLKSMFNINDIQGKAKIINEILISISCFRNAVVKSEYLKRLAQELDVAEEDLKIEIRKIESSNNKRLDAKTVNSPILKHNAVEKLLMKILLEDPKCISKIKTQIRPSDFQNRHFNILAETLFDFSSKGKFVNPSQLISYFLDSDISGLISELINSKEVIPEDKDEMLDDCIKRIKQTRYKMRLQDLHEQIESVKNDPKRTASLVEEYNVLMKSGRD